MILNIIAALILITIFSENIWGAIIISIVIIFVGSINYIEGWMKKDIN